jgi:hypothetical protein
MLPWNQSSSRRASLTPGMAPCVTPSSSLPPRFGVRPPHCLKKNATPAPLQDSRSSRSHSTRTDRQPRPLSRQRSASRSARGRANASDPLTRRGSRAVAPRRRSERPRGRLAGRRRASENLRHRNAFRRLLRVPFSLGRHGWHAREAACAVARWSPALPHDRTRDAPLGCAPVLRADRLGR